MSDTPIEARPVMTISEFAKATDLHEGTVRNAIREGQIPVIRIGRRILISRVWFDRTMNAAPALPSSTLEVR